MPSRCGIAALVASAALAVLVQTGTSMAIKSPHVLLVVADDYGWNDVGYHQSNETTNIPLKTPTLDRLASEGRKLERYYVQPLCSPTRGTILTGRYPSHTGIGPNVIRPAHPYGMPGTEVLLPERMRDLGYSTHAVGKWHLGLCDERMTPTFRGFDSFTGYLLGAEDYFEHTRVWNGKSGLDFRNGTGADKLAPACRSGNGTYSTELFTGAVDRIVQTWKAGNVGEDSKKPLFVYMAFQSVHGPLQAPEKYINLYPATMNKNRRTYAGMVSALDAAVAELERIYTDAGIWDDTVMVFTTDNGGPTYDSANNFPLRGYKATAWEGGVRGVAFVRGASNPRLASAAVPANSVSHELMHSTDWFPTLTGLAAVGGEALVRNARQGKPLDGHDQWPSIAQGKPTTRNLVVHNSPAASVKARGGGIRNSQYKLLFASGLTQLNMQVPGNIRQIPPPGFKPAEGQVCDPPKPVKVNGTNLYLFDTVADPNECNNLASEEKTSMRPEHAQALDELLAAFDDHQKTAVPDLALSHGTDDPAADPAKRKDQAWGPWSARSSKCRWDGE